MNELEDLVAAYRILAAHGVIDAYGHVSLRSPKNPQRYYLAKSIAPEKVRPEDLIEYDLDSKPLDDNGRESVRERFIHGEIFKTRPEVMAEGQNHPPSGVAVFGLGLPLHTIFFTFAGIIVGIPQVENVD